MTVLFDSNSRPIAHADIDDLLRAIDLYPDEQPRPKMGKDKAVRLLAYIRRKYPDPLPLDNCVCARNCGDEKDSFNLRYLENSISAGRQWMTVVRKGKPSLVWERVGTGHYRLRRGRYLCRAWEDFWKRQELTGQPIVERRRGDRRSSSGAVWRPLLPDPEDDFLLVQSVKQLYLRTGDSLARARANFDTLSARYPHYPWSRCLSVCTCQQLMDYGHSPWTDLREELEQARSVTLRSGRECYSFRIAQGTYYYHRHQVGKAIREFEQATRLSSYWTGWRWLAECYMTLGKTARAIECIGQAGVCCDYSEPFLNGIQMLIQVYGGQPQQALRLPLGRERGDTHPKTAAFAARARLALAFKALTKNDKDAAALHLLDAEQQLDAAWHSGENDSLWLRTEYLSVYGAGREIARCQEEGAFDVKLNQTWQRCERATDRDALRALQHIALGHHEQALEYLESAVEQRDSMVLNMQWDPRFYPLRRTPAFRELCKYLRQRFTEEAE